MKNRILPIVALALATGALSGCVVDDPYEHGARYDRDRGYYEHDRRFDRRDDDRRERYERERREERY